MIWVLHIQVFLVWGQHGEFLCIYSAIHYDLFLIHRYGSAHDGFLVANATLHGMLWLAQYEFAMPERESKLGTMMWPEW
jgi:hypothetical protein